MADFRSVPVPPHIPADDMLGAWVSPAEELLVLENGRYEWRRTTAAPGISEHGGQWITDGDAITLLPDTDADQFTSCCERLREAFANAEPVGVQVHNLSLSAGMTLLSAGDDLDEALQRADQALYRAKRGGRNRCDAAWEGAGA